MASKIHKVEQGYHLRLGNDQCIPFKTKPQRYQTHDNGTRPFVVVYEDHKLYLFGRIIGTEDYEYLNSYDYQQVFVGSNTGKYKNPYEKTTPKGTSLLFKLDDLTYLFVGENVLTFEVPQEITHFQSNMGNSDVIYPFALSNDYVYILLEDYVIVPRNIFKSVNIYDEYYAVRKDHKFKKFKTHIIYPRRV